MLAIFLIFVSFLLLFLIFYFVAPILRLFVRQCRSPLHLLPGPSSPSFFMGNLAELHDQENTNLVGQWVETYGSTFVYRGFIGGCRLMTTDPVAVAHILRHAYDYPKHDFVRDSLATMAAGHEGLLTVEGDHHERQSPAFASTHIKSLTSMFWSKASELKDIWLSEADENTCSYADCKPPFTRVDALIWLGRATLDVIGLAGFGYTFNSLANATSRAVQENELANAFSVIFSTARKFRLITILRKFRQHNATMVKTQDTMRRIGAELVKSKTDEIIAELKSTRLESLTMGEKNLLGRDLLSVLSNAVRSNLSTIPSQRMSINEVLCQISTFIAAGHETTASAMMWCLYALAKDQRVQNKLRNELRLLKGRAPLDDRDHSLTDRLLQCNYLDWVVRESLRLHAPVTSTMRVCMHEFEIPLSSSSDSSTRGGYIDKNGRRRWSIQLKKWDIISVPIQAINKSKELWGEDALEFSPERWASPLPETARSIPGLFANTLTFLNGNGSPSEGNRACIGFKFAISEIKIFLYVFLKDRVFHRFQRGD